MQDFIVDILKIWKLYICILKTDFYVVCAKQSDL